MLAKASLNRRVFNDFLKDGREKACLISNGSLFYKEGAKDENFLVIVFLISLKVASSRVRSERVVLDRQVDVIGKRCSEVAEPRWGGGRT